MSSLDAIIDKYQESERIRLQRERDSEGYSLIEKFIQRTGGIVYGTMTIKALLGHAKVPLKEYYYSVYSYRAKENSFELANEMYETGLPLVELKRESNGTFAVYYKNQKACAFFQVPQQEYNNLPIFDSNKNLISENIKYAGLDVIKAHLMQIFTNPRFEIQKWIPMFQVYLELNARYPVPTRSGRGSGTSETGESPSKIVKKKFIDKEKDLVIIGANAFVKYVPRSGIQEGIYEVLSFKPQEHLDKLRELLGPDVSIKKNINHLKLHGPKYSISKGDKKVLDLYDSGEDCVQYIELVDGLKYGNIHVLLRYLYSGVLTSFKIEGGLRLRERLYWMISKLQEGSEELDKDFQIKCFGKQKNIERDFRIKKWEGELKDKLFIFSYKPEIFKEKHGKLMKV